MRPHLYNNRIATQVLEYMSKAGPAGIFQAHADALPYGQAETMIRKSSLDIKTPEGRSTLLKMIEDAQVRHIVEELSKPLKPKSVAELIKANSPTPEDSPTPELRIAPQQDLQSRTA